MHFKCHISIASNQIFKYGVITILPDSEPAVDETMESANKVTNKKILILEDNQDILDVLNDWLSDIGYKVAAYNETTDIIPLAVEIRPDLILMDYLLGGINGGEYCHQLKHHPETSHIPVIMLSAHQRVIDSLGHYGWDAFVAKPFDLEELAQQIETLIRKSLQETY